MSRSFKNNMIFESSLPGTLALLLENDIADAKKALDKIIKSMGGRKAKLSSLINSLPSGGYKDILTNDFQNMLEPLTKVEEMIEKLSADGTEEAQAKEIGILLDQVKDTSTSMSYLLKVNNGAISYMAQQILSSNLHKGDDKDTPLGVIFKEADLLDQAKKEFQAAIKTSLNDNQIKKAKKGFFANLADSVFGSSPGVMNIAKESAEASFNGILELTPLEVGEFAMKMVNYGKEDEKASEQVEDAVNNANEDIQDDAGSPATETGDEDKGDEDKGDENKGASISKKELKSKAESIAGSAGALVVDKLLKSDFFKEFNITESLRNMSLQILLEQKIPAEDYTNIVAQAMEDNEDAFKDVDSNSLAKDLNKLFKDSNVDVEIEEKPLTWNDLDDKGKRRAQLRFWLDGKSQTSGTPSKDTIESLLYTYQKAELNAEDLADTDVDINNTLYDQNGKGAEKLGDIPELVNLINSVIDKNDDYKDLRLEKDDTDQLEETDGEAAAEEVDTELKDAAKDAIGSNQSPAAGAISALEDWETNLAPTSQKQLQAKDRIGQLKDLVKTGIEDGATALEGEVGAAIDLWIEEHQETLVKSRRFSKKNFATLKNVVGQIVSKLVTKESKSMVTRDYVRTVTFAHLDNEFNINRSLNESKQLSRLRKLAGI